MRFILFFTLMLIPAASFAEVTRAHKNYLLNFLKDLGGDAVPNPSWAPLGGDEIGGVTDEGLKDLLTSCRYRDSLLDKWLPEYSDRSKCSEVIVDLLLSGKAAYGKIGQTASALQVFSPKQEERIEKPIVP